MDSAHLNKTRKFPGYTLAQLKATLANPPDIHTPELLAQIAEEVRRREAGLSVAFRVPQI